nr:hypothetical protein [Amycolatopsis thermoflava]
MPGRSRRGRPGTRSSDRPRASSSTITDSGTFARNADREVQAAVSTPPSTGPHTAASHLTGPIAPSARDSAGSVNIARISPMVCGMITAADAPCAARNTINAPASGARAHASEVSRNAVTPSRNTRRHPARSPSRPPVIISATNGRV